MSVGDFGNIDVRQGDNVWHFTNEEAASAVYDKLQKESRRTQDVWSLKLTPELKKDLLKGGVTFGVAGVAAMDQDNETLGLLKKPRK
jgi:hypothetical protein